MREAEMADVKKTVDGLNDSVSSGTSFNPIQTIRDEIRNAVEGTNPASTTTTAAEPTISIPSPPPVPDLTPEQIAAALAPVEPVVEATEPAKKNASGRRGAPAALDTAGEVAASSAVTTTAAAVPDEAVAPAKPKRKTAKKETRLRVTTRAPPDEPGGYRGHEGAPSGSSHRTQGPAHQGHDRVHGDVRDLLRFRQADLQRADLPLRARGRRRVAGEAHRHRMLEFCSRRSRLPCSGELLPFPVVATQIYKFVAPGLYKNERDAFRPYLIATPVLFMVGAAVVFFIAMPIVMRFSIGQQQLVPGEAVIELLPKVSEYLSLIMTLIFAFGITFQLPVVLTRLARAGFIDAQFLREQAALCHRAGVRDRRRADSADIISQLALGVLTLLLYEASIIAVQMVGKEARGRRGVHDGVTRKRQPAGHRRGAGRWPAWRRVISSFGFAMYDIKWIRENAARVRPGVDEPQRRAPVGRAAGHRRPPAACRDPDRAVRAGAPQRALQGNRAGDGRQGHGPRGCAEGRGRRR